jgi:hypothetical protein
MNASMALRLSLLAALALTLLALPATASATSPRACIDWEEGYNTAAVFEPHELSALCTFDGDGHDLVSFEWDLDGDGSYEFSSGSMPYVTHEWEDRGAHLDATVNVGLRVTDAAGESGTLVEPIRITDDINSWFTYQPQLVNPGDVVDLDAYIRPYDVTATEWTYEWDLDGDGSFEHSSGLIPDATLLAPDAIGPRPVGLRVTDDVGNVSTVRRNIEVLPRHPSRDQIVYEAPQNLVAAPEVRTAPLFPGGPSVPVGPSAEELTPAPAPPAKKGRLKKVDSDRHGLRLHYVDGPKWTRWKATVRIPAKRAASYGLPRRTIVLARGTVVFDGRGVGRSNRMRWTKGAYKVFRQVRFSTIDILRKRVA